MRTRIKICGITRTRDAELVAQSGADAIGLNFYPKSPRCIDIEQAKDVSLCVQPYVTTVAVVVNPQSQLLDTLAKQNIVDRIQFHGDETDQDCQKSGMPYYKALRIDSSSNVKQLAQTYQTANALLLDTYVEGLPGGTGRVFDWLTINAGEIKQPIILAGGMSVENVYDAILTVKPYAVDVASGVEAKPGIKDAVKLNEFIIAVQEADKKLIQDFQ